MEYTDPGYSANYSSAPSLPLSASCSALSNENGYAPCVDPAVRAESVQYLNGFLRTQIGRQASVDFLVGSNTIIKKQGTLIAVGLNYIILKENGSDDITVCDFYNIKFIRFFA